MEKKDILDGVDFSELDDDFYLEIEFDSIKAFRTEGSYSRLRNGHFHGYIGISFSNDGHDKPRQNQLNALYYFQDNQEQILNSLCASFINDYPELMKRYEQNTYDQESGFPELINPEQVKKLIGIEGLCIRNQEKDDVSYYGISFCCPWDEEHGLGILMHKNRVILVDRADIFCVGGRTEIEKDNGTYSEEKHKKELEELEKSRQEYISSLKEKKDTRKWWEFWK